MSLNSARKGFTINPIEGLFGGTEDEGSSFGDVLRSMVGSGIGNEVGEVVKDDIATAKQLYKDIKTIVGSVHLGNTDLSKFGSAIENGALSLIGSNASSGSASGLGSSGSGGITDQQLYQNAYDLINQTAQANNDWSADQALRQMQFQEYMSSTAHRREVEDLKAAGLNPVLSAGGSGASTPSGAMGITDTGNTRAIADVAMMAIDAVQNTATGFAAANSSKSGKGFFDNYYVKRALGTVASTTARIGTKALLGAIGL